MSTGTETSTITTEDARQIVTLAGAYVDPVNAAAALAFERPDLFGRARTSDIEPPDFERVGLPPEHWGQAHAALANPEGRERAWTLVDLAVKQADGLGHLIRQG